MTRPLAPCKVTQKPLWGKKWLLEATFGGKVVAWQPLWGKKWLLEATFGEMWLPVWVGTGAQRREQRAQWQVNERSSKH